MTSVEASEPVNADKGKSQEVVKQQDEQKPLPQLSTRIRNDGLNPMELLTQRAIAIQLKSLGIEFTDSALEDLFDLVSTYMHGLLEGLQKITQTQRRFKASPKDLRLLLRDYNISTSELEEVLIHSQGYSEDVIQAKKDLESLAKTTLEDVQKSVDEIDPQDPSFVFFATDQDLSKLMPPQHKRITAIPRWLPEFPPDHTYRRTPKYLDRIKDQKLVRQKVVEEGKFGEQALENLIKYGKNIDEDYDFTEVDEPKQELEEEEVTEKKPEVEVEKIDLWSSNEKKFDVQAYANARLKFYKEKEEKKKKKMRKIDHEYYELIAQLSPFYSGDANETVSPELYLEREFKKTLHSLKSLKKKKAERQVERERLQEEEDQRRDELKAQKPVDFNDFDNFDNFDNFENFDRFGSGDEGSNGANEIHFEGDTVKENSKASEEPSVALQVTDDDKSDTAPINSQANQNEASEPNVPPTENLQNSTLDSPGESAQRLQDITMGSETPEQTSEFVTSDASELRTILEPPSTAAQTTTDDGDGNREENEDDDHEDDDLFDDVPLA